MAKPLTDFNQLGRRGAVRLGQDELVQTPKRAAILKFLRQRGYRRTDRCRSFGIVTYSKSFAERQRTVSVQIWDEEGGNGRVNCDFHGCSDMRPREFDDVTSLEAALEHGETRLDSAWA